MVTTPAAVFRALGHPARLRIVEALADGERCVADLVALVGLVGSTVSRHLAVLREAGVVTGEKRGSHIHCSLALPCVAAFTRCIHEAAQGREVVLSTRPCCPSQGAQDGR